MAQSPLQSAPRKRREKKKITTVMIEESMEHDINTWADAHSISKSAAIRYMVAVFLDGKIGKSKDALGKSND